MKYNRIQLLRGLAAAAVLVSHFAYLNATDGESPDGRVVQMGSYAVYVFFAISGFIIYESQARAEPGAKGVIAYLKKRSARIYPAYIVWSLIGLLVYYVCRIPTWDHHWDLLSVNDWRSLATATTLLPFRFTPGSEHFTFSAVGWSLMYEVCFYVIFLLYFVNSRWRVVVAIALTGLCVRVPIKWPFFALNPISLLFAAGIALSMLAKRVHINASIARTSMWLGICCIGGCCLIFPRPTVYINMSAAMLGAVLIVGGSVFLDKTKPLRNTALTRPLLFIGSSSYSLYLCHYIVITLLHQWLGKNPNSSVSLALLYVFLPIGIAAVSYQIVERPFLKLGRRAIPVRPLSDSIMAGGSPIREEFESSNQHHHPPAISTLGK